MAILDKLAGLGGAVKSTFDRTFGEATKVDDDDDVAALPVGLDLAQAWGVLGLTASATLDDVRAASRTLARLHHPGSVRKDAAAAVALARVAEASALLEEHLLPLVPSKVPGPAAALTSKRTRATARTPR